MNPNYLEPKRRRRCDPSQTKPERDPHNIRSWQKGTIWTDCNKPQPLRIRDTSVRYFVDESIVEKIQNMTSYREDGSIFLTEEFLDLIKSWKTYINFIADQPTIVNLQTFAQFMNEIDTFEVMLGTIHLLPKFIDLPTLINFLSILENKSFEEFFTQEIVTDAPFRLKVYKETVKLAIRKLSKES